MADEVEKKDKHAVHIFYVVRVKVLLDPKDVSDDKPETLIKAAEARVDPFDLLNKAGRGDIEAIEYAEDISHFMIDKAGDAGYKGSQFYVPDPHKDDGVYVMPPGRRCVAVTLKDGVVNVVANYPDTQHVILDHDTARDLKKTVPPPFEALEPSYTPCDPELKIVEEFNKEYYA